MVGETDCDYYRCHKCNKSFMYKSGYPLDFRFMIYLFLAAIILVYFTKH